MKEEMFMAYKW